MKFNSLQSKINLIFFIAFILLAINFLAYFKFQKDFMHAPAVTAHEKLSQYMFEKRLSRIALIDYLESLNFEVEYKHRPVLRYGKIVKVERGFETIYYEKNYYFHATTPFFRLLFKDKQKYPDEGRLPLITFSIIFIGLIFLYLWLRKSLSPLYKLKTNINRLSNGDLSINCKSNKNDEIAAISNEFDFAVSKINLLLDSRQLFLRTVMHELKTPIAKGRIVAELISDDKQKNRMAIIFDKLDFLINDFARIEKVVSQNYSVTKQSPSLQSVLEYAKSMLLIEDDSQIIIEIKDNIRLDIDFELMTMVFKNLIDNALKYSTDKSIRIKVQVDAIYFISKGKPLSKDISEYFKPFHNETGSKNHGMGLGLYIVKSIVDIHDFEFQYINENESNIFKIIYN